MDILKNKYTLGAIFVSIFALLIRLWNLNLNKGLWWDSASFIIMTQRLVTGSSCLWEAHRLPGFPFLLSPFYAIFGLNVDVFRIVVIIFSALSVLAVYFLGKKLFSGRIGLVASIFLAFSWLNYFYGLRVLSRVPAALFLILCVYFFWEGWTKKNWKMMFISGLMWGIYYTIRFDAVFLFGAFAIFVLMDLIKSKNKIEFLKRKEIWIFILACAIAIAPYLIWQTALYGSPISQMGLNYELTKNYGESYFDQFGLMGHILSTGWLIFFVTGLIFSSLKIKNKKYLLILLIFFIFFIGLMISPHHEDRYFLPVLPIAGIIAAIGLEGLVNLFIKKKNWRTITILCVALLLGGLCLSYGMPIITAKGPTYESVQRMGIEIGDLPNDVVYAPFSGVGPLPQLCLWNDKEYIKFPDTSEEFFENFNEGDSAYCSIGYDTCPDYLLPKVSTEEELLGVLSDLQDQNITPVKMIKDNAGAISILFEKRSVEE